MAPGRILLLALAAAAAVAAATLAAHAADDRLVVADADGPPPAGALGLFARSRGRALFLQHCADCHGRDGRGDAHSGVPDLADQDWLYGSGRVSEIETIVAHGVRAFAPKTWKLADMPAFGQPHPSAAEPGLQPLTPGQVADLTEHLLALERRPHDAAAADRGRAVYLGPGGCFDCHGQDGRGDPGIGAPNLADGVWLYGHGAREEIARSIRQGRRGRCPAWADRLTQAQIREIAIYVHGLSARPGAARGS